VDPASNLARKLKLDPTNIFLRAKITCWIHFLYLRALKIPEKENLLCQVYKKI